MSAAISESFAIGDAYFAECGVVHDFIGASVRPIVDRVAESTRADHSTYLGALIRVTAWLRSLAKLNHPGDFQAIVTGSRALFEIAVDLTLVHHDPANHSHAKMLAWERSAKLKHAERIARYFDARGVAVPEEEREALGFIAREGSAIRSERFVHWPNGKHPERWTARSLVDDAKKADTFTTDAFEEFYVTRFAPLCWNTHGSGLAGVRMLSEENFPAVSALALGECARFAVLSAGLVLRLFGQHDSIAQRRFQALELARLEKRARVLSTYPKPRP